MRYNTGMKQKKHPTSMRLTATAEKLIAKLSEKLGVSKSAVLELAIRNLAQQQGITIEGGTDD